LEEAKKEIDNEKLMRHEIEEKERLNKITSSISLKPDIPIPDISTIKSEPST